METRVKPTSRQVLPGKPWLTLAEASATLRNARGLNIFAWRFSMLLPAAVLLINLSMPAVPGGTGFSGAAKVILPGDRQSAPDSGIRFLPFRLRMLGVPSLLRNQNDPHPDLKIENHPGRTASGTRRTLFSTQNLPPPARMPDALQHMPASRSGPQSSGMPVDSSSASLSEKWVERYDSELQASNDL